MSKDYVTEAQEQVDQITGGYTLVGGQFVEITEVQANDDKAVLTCEFRPWAGADPIQIVIIAPYNLYITTYA